VGDTGSAEPTLEKLFTQHERVVVKGYFLLHQTMVTPMHTTAIPIHLCRLMRSPRNAFAPNAPAA
jgi:hypothetical protein